jgi:hypothetical protein
MKAVLIPLTVLLLAGCASKRAPSVAVRPRAVSGTTLPSEGIESVRCAENIKAYPLARYVDPNNRRLMHEAHTIYRVETTPRWNLHSNQLAAVQRGPATRTSNTLSETAPARDELIVELNRQKEATNAVIQGSQTVSQKLGQLGESVQQTKQVAAENVILRREVDATQQRLQYSRRGTAQTKAIQTVVASGRPL